MRGSVKTDRPAVWPGALIRDRTPPAVTMPTQLPVMRPEPVRLGFGVAGMGTVLVSGPVDGVAVLLVVGVVVGAVPGKATPTGAAPVRRTRVAPLGGAQGQDREGRPGTDNRIVVVTIGLVHHGMGAAGQASGMSVRRSLMRVTRVFSLRVPAMYRSASRTVWRCWSRLSGSVAGCCCCSECVALCGHRRSPRGGGVGSLWSWRRAARWRAKHATAITANRAASATAFGLPRRTTPAWTRQ